jgi:hypothetical protein
MAKRISTSELIENLYGVKTRYVVNDLTSTVGVTTTQILSQNPNRVSILILNISANGIYISPLRDVSSTKGVYLAPNGGYIMFQFDKDFQMVTSEFHSIATGAASPIYILENIIR